VGRHRWRGRLLAETFGNGDRRVATLVAAIASFSMGCGVYSFTGASIPAHIRTVAIPLAEDNSLNTLSALDEQFTEMLLRRFVQQTRLTLQPDEAQADAVLTVRIDRYTNVPTSVSGEERATLNRVSVNIAVVYRDMRNDQDILNRSFSAFEEYDPNDPERGLTGEQDAATAALEKVADDIFTAATSNW
jgi:hypothetical protein